MSYFDCLPNQNNRTTTNSSKKNLGQSNFDTKIEYTTFEYSNLSAAHFKKDVRDSNFINAYLVGATFKKVDGYTSFSGANLDKATFQEPCGKNVVFIGSNIGSLLEKPKGGIQTVEQLKQALDKSMLSEEEINTLYSTLSYAYEAVENCLNIFQTLPVHINSNHLDHIFRAIILLEPHIHSHSFIPN